MGIAVYGTLCCLGAAAVGLALTPLAIYFARSFGMVDEPNVRKVHRAPVPRIGGIPIAIATLLAAGVTLSIYRHDLGHGGTGFWPILTLCAGAVALLFIGFIDDVYEIPSKYKLLALMAASFALCASGTVIHTATINGRMLLDLGFAAWPLTMLWLVTVTVSINFIDGLDGLAGGIVAIACGVLAMGALMGGAVAPALVALALMGALGAFLCYNFHPAKIFMGDCGSMFVGYLLAGLCVVSSQSIGSTRSLILPALALAIPLFDTAFTMVRRGVLQRRSLFAAERGHIHHRLLDVGLCHLHVVLLLHLITLCAAVVGTICIFGGRWASAISATFLCVGLTAFFRAADTVRARETLAAIRRNRAIGRRTRRYQQVFYELQLRFREAKTFDEWWQQLCVAAEMLDFAKLDLPLVKRDGTEYALRWRRDGELVADVNSITAEIPIPQRRSAQQLRAEVEVFIEDSLECGGHRVALFSRLMSEFGPDRLPRRGAAAQPQAVQEKTPSDAPGAFPSLRVAIVHDFLYTYAGAERVLEQLIKVFPQAQLFSLFDFLPDSLRGFIKNKSVTPSFLQHMPFARSKHRAYLPLMPLAIEQLDVSGYDLVISSSYVAAKGVITRPDQLHICYCHTPVRFAWELQNQYLGQVGLTHGLKAMAAKIILHYIRGWDLRSANGVDVFVTNSDFVGRRIEKVYRRSSSTIYPPVDINYFKLCEEKEDYYLTASRMVPYKRIDLIVEAFARMPHRRLLVVGDGPEMQRIKAKAGPNVTFLGHEPTDRLLRHMQLARAFVFAAEEDFGITPVEAQACGTPVIAFGRGGVTESVIHAETGVFFTEQTVEALIHAVDRFESMSWDAPRIRVNAERFSNERFRQDIVEFVRKQWSAFKAARLARANRLGVEQGNVGFDTTPLLARDREEAEDDLGVEVG
jgi:UDP-N-acetylmuramyl pentapeptide phosphotransferase/UDP-N-acetylglucosamine-1-phosphate transferase/glycosyltransferase involved in cell wall biosynthesis